MNIDKIWPENDATGDDLVDTPTFATEIQAKEPTVISWRSKGTGPDFIRCGRLIRYRRSDVNRWLEENTQRQSGCAPNTSRPGDSE